jgi:hypothetical protein
MSGGRRNLDPRNLIVLAYRHSLYRVDRNCKVVGSVNDADNIKYVSQGLEIDLEKELYRTRFGADHRGNYIQNGFIVKDGWLQIGTAIIPRGGSDYGDGLIGVYDKTNFKHLQSMLWGSHDANDRYTTYE